MAAPENGPLGAAWEYWRGVRKKLSWQAPMLLMLLAGAVGCLR
ncbi:MAG: hypothetical protein U1U88_000530 [Lawsonella clevelandensis]